VEERKTEERGSLRIKSRGTAISDGMKERSIAAQMITSDHVAFFNLSPHAIPIDLSKSFDCRRP